MFSSVPLIFVVEAMSGALKGAAIPSDI